MTVIKRVEHSRHVWITSGYWGLWDYFGPSS